MLDYRGVRLERFHCIQYVCVIMHVCASTLSLCPCLMMDAVLCKMTVYINIQYNTVNCIMYVYNIYVYSYVIYTFYT